MENNGLLICPTCQMNNIKNVLGSITPTGDLSIMRHSQSYVVIQSPSMMIICQCGFGTVINHGKGDVSYIQTI
jgi:hypothetical protein